MSSLGRKSRTKGTSFTEEAKLQQRIRNGAVLDTHNELVDNDWDYSKNYFGPENFGPGSSEKVHWICKGKNDGTVHKFQRSISERTQACDILSKSRGCPVCSGAEPPKREVLAIAFPQLAREWMTKEDGCSASVVYTTYTTSSKLAQWGCPAVAEHEYKSKVYARTDSTVQQGCPQCYTGPNVDLSHFPQALKRYDRSSNNRGFNPKRLPVIYKVFWKCLTNSKHRLYESFVVLQRRNFECLRCHKENAPKLSDYPHLVAQIHPTKNGFVRPRILAARSHAVIIWLCPNGSDHEWEAPINKRTIAGEGCPYCSNERECRSNSLASFPNLAAEFNRSKNGGLAAESVLATSNTPYWWLCSACGAEWQTAARYRLQLGVNCPVCKSLHLKQSKNDPNTLSNLAHLRPARHSAQGGSRS